MSYNEAARLAKHNPLRMCLLSREEHPKADMIRFVLSPQNQVVADLAEKLPGRGAWVLAKADNITKAAETGLFNKAFKTKAPAQADLEAQVISLLRKRCLDLLALARRGGEATSGFMKVKDASEQYDGFFLSATDASENAVKKLRSLAQERPLFSLFSSDEMAGIFARETVMNVFVRNQGAAKHLARDINRFLELRA